MNDPVQVPQNWLIWIAGTIAGLFSGNFMYFRRKFDRLGERVNACVTREELAAIEARIEARALAAENRTVTMHSDNTNHFREVRLQLESVNTKLFELAAKK